MAIITETKTFYPTGWDSTHSIFASNTNTSTFSNFIGKSETNGSYGQVYLTTGSRAETKLFIDYDFSSIPSNATITSITGKAKAYGSGSTTYVTNKQIGEAINQEFLGTPVTFGTSTAAFNLSFSSNITRKQLENMQLLMYFKRGTSSTTSNFYGRFYGASITVTYSYDDSAGGDKLYLKDNNTWKEVQKVYKKINGNWVEQENISEVFDTNANYVKTE